jgi:hypothetical protein
MIEADTSDHAPPPERPRFQFTLRTLFLVFVVLASSLAVFGPWGVVIFGLAAVLAFDQYHSQRSSRTADARIAFLCFISVCAWFFFSHSHMRETARCVACSNKVRQIANALQQYHRANGAYPPAYIADASGKPIHSWRYLLLPYLDYKGPFYKYNFAEPWNGPNNSALTATRLPGFVCPSDGNSLQTSPSFTNYVAVVGQNAAWQGDKPRKLADFGNNAADTILVIEVVNSGIQWAEPKDLSLDSLSANDATFAAMPGSNHGPKSEFFFVNDGADGAYAIMADGSIRYLYASSLTPDVLPALLQIGGCKEKQIAPGAELYEYGRHLNWPNIAALAVWLVSVVALLRRAVRSRPKETLRTPLIND